ncbi:hypothetical protein AMTRI_Chr13g92510 [Amborella trichopoda]
MTYFNLPSIFVPLISLFFYGLQTLALTL